MSLASRLSERGPRETFYIGFRYILVFIASRLFGTATTLLSNIIEGRSLYDSSSILGYWGSVDRIDPRLSVPALTPHQYDSLERTDHLSRYLFAIQVFSEFQSGASSTHLDVAGGLGYGTSLIGEWLEAEAVGVEIDGESVGYANRHYGENGTFIRGDATQLPLQTDSVTTVTCFETLEHIQDEELLLEQLDRVLISDGILIISVPNDEQVDSTVEEEKQFPHVNTYTPQRFTQLLESTFGPDTVSLFNQYKQLKIPDSKRCDTPPHPTGIYPYSNQASSDQLIAIVDKQPTQVRLNWRR